MNHSVKVRGAMEGLHDLSVPTLLEYNIVYVHT